MLHFVPGPCTKIIDFYVPTANATSTEVQIVATVAQYHRSTNEERITSSSIHGAARRRSAVEELAAIFELAKCS